MYPMQTRKQGVRHYKIITCKECKTICTVRVPLDFQYGNGLIVLYKSNQY